MKGDEGGLHPPFFDVSGDADKTMIDDSID